MMRLIRKSNSLMLLISNASAFESVKLLLHLFSETSSLLILIKRRNKLEKYSLIIPPPASRVLL